VVFPVREDNLRLESVFTTLQVLVEQVFAKAVHLSLLLVFRLQKVFQGHISGNHRFSAIHLGTESLNIIVNHLHVQDDKQSHAQKEGRNKSRQKRAPTALLHRKTQIFPQNQTRFNSLVDFKLLSSEVFLFGIFAATALPAPTTVILTSTTVLAATPRA